MDALDLFPTAGIRFIPTAHEQGAGHMADGYSLEMTAKGDPISATKALDAGLIDKIVGEDSLEADAIAFGRPFIANPDLPERLRRDAPLNPPDPAFFYGVTGARGYTDYPALSA